MTDRFLIGSTALNFLEKPRDRDYIVIGEKNSVEKIKGDDCHFRTLENIRRQNVLDPTMTKGLFCVSYQLDNRINKESPFDLCVFEHTESIRSFLKELTDKRSMLVNPHIIEFRKNVTPKFRYHVFLLYTLLQNEDYKFTKKQIDVMQKIHDKEMPTEFSYDFLKELEKWVHSGFEHKNGAWYEKYVL